jgi:hypothetical protein
MDEEKKVEEVFQYEAEPVIKEMMEEQLVILSGSTGGIAIKTLKYK